MDTSTFCNSTWTGEVRSAFTGQVLGFRFDMVLIGLKLLLDSVQAGLLV